MASYADEYKMFRAACDAVEASQDYTSQKEVMAYSSRPESEIEHLYCSLTEFAQRLDERHKVLLQSVEGLERNLSEAKMELRMINAALEQYNADLSTPAVKYDTN